MILATSTAEYILLGLAGFAVGLLISLASR